MIKITDRERDIPQGAFYVKYGEYYVYDDKKVVIEYLPELFKRGGKVFVLALKDSYYVFDFIGRKVELRDKSEGVEDYLFLYPQAVVADANSLKKSKVKTKGIKLDKKHAVLFMSLALAVVVLVGVIKKRNQQAVVQAPPVQTQPTPTPALPQCYENVSSFLENYVSYAQVKDGQVFVKVGDSTYGLPLKQVETKPLEGEVVVKPGIEKSYDPEGVVFRARDYYDCLWFINANSDKPITIRRLSYEENSCEFVISYACLGTASASPAGTTNANPAGASW